MPIRAVIFDFGGVIVRTEDRTSRSQLAEQTGMTYAELEQLVFDAPTAIQATLGKIPVEKHWESVVNQLSIPCEKILDFQNRFWGGDRLDSELVDYIRSLRGPYKTALLSNAWSDLRQYLERHWKIVDAFDEIFISAEIGLAKPDPRIYRLVVDRLGVTPLEAVFVDDFNENVEAAREAGLHAVRFKNPTQVQTDVQALLDTHPGD